MLAGPPGRLVLVGGEAGVGKTALVRAFTEQSGARVLWGACDPLETPRPLGPLLDVADAAGGELLEAVAADARPSALVPALLRELRAAPGTVLVLEDVHWADEGTLDALRLIGRRIGTVPALVVATFRDDAGPALRIVLGELATAAGVVRIGLSPLTAPAVRALAEPHGVDGDDLHRRTGGNPFYVTEVLSAPAAAIPATVRDAVLARAARLSDEARELLARLAVVPGAADAGADRRRRRAARRVPARRAWSGSTAAPSRSGTSWRALPWRRRSRRGAGRRSHRQVLERLAARGADPGPPRPPRGGGRRRGRRAAARAGGRRARGAPGRSPRGGRAVRAHAALGRRDAACASAPSCSSAARTSAT